MAKGPFSSGSHGGALRRPKILVVTPRFPYPVIGGDRLRIVRVCEELAKDFDLTLASLCDSSAEMRVPAPALSPFASIHRVLLRRWRSDLNALLALPTRSPLEVAYYRSRALRRSLAALVDAHDLILGHLVRVADYALDQGKPSVIEMTDAISMNYERVRSIHARVGRFRAKVYGVECDRIRRYERSVVERADLSVLVSSIDRNRLLGDDPALLARSVVVPNGVNTDTLPYSFSRTGARICFIGNMTTVQNLDAARVFAEGVLPLVRRECREATFEIVGRIVRRGRRLFEGMPGVRVVGSVPDMAMAVRGAAVGVCPMRLGAGIQNKVLEYMALGIPAVISSVALEGLAARPGMDLLVADEPRDVAGAVAELIRDRDRAEVLAIAAHEYVSMHHAWPAALAPLRARIANIISRSH